MNWRLMLMRAGAIAIAVALVLAGVAAGRHFPYKRPVTVIEEKTDTLYIRDTISCVQPLYVTRRVTDTVAVVVTDTVMIRDTIYAFMEREQLKWRDSLCEVYASGIMPSVDSVMHFVNDKMIVVRTLRDTEKADRTRRWGIGVQAGYGATLNGDAVRLSPYFGVGISYNIMTF